MTAYIEAEELKYTLQLTGTTFAENDIEPAITSASEAIDAVTGRTDTGFGKATETRYYTPELTAILGIDDLASLAGLTVTADQDADGTYEQTWTNGTDFTLSPINAPLRNRPYTTLGLHPTGRYLMPIGVPSGIKIVGEFGWPAVPAVVKEATTILAAKLLRRAREAPFGVVTAGIETGVAMRIARTDPDVAALLVGVSRNSVQQA